MHRDDPSALPVQPQPEGLHGRLALAQVRARMFGREPTTRFGRYRVVSVLGRGAQGQVVEAHDDELGRRVALKLIEPRRDGRPDAVERRRVLREARAMALVQHPHVVTAYAVGTADDHVWIAMELVAGRTLSGWVSDNPIGTPERFERARRLLLQAGSGLAAAHARGIVHRDFKPANVLVGEGEVAKVADFGLAVPAGPEPDLDARHGATADSLATLSRPGAGTPRYMSPEQRRGMPVGPASDQFNFAVTAWEVVYGTQPFSTTTTAAFLDAVFRGPVRPHVPSVPPWYGQALRRALAPDPAARYPSMEALLAALEPPPSRRGTMVAAVAAMGGLAWLWAAVAAPGGDTARCDDSVARARVDETFNDAHGRALRDAVTSSGLPDADAIAAELVADLSTYAAQWQVTYAQACRARWEDGRIDEQELDATMACLDDRLDVLDAVTDRLSAADLAVATRATTTVRSLLPPQSCTEAKGRRARPTTPEARRLRRRLATAEVERMAGRYEQAGTLARAVADDAHASGLETTAADALEVAALAWGELQDDRATAAFVESHALAVAHDDDLAAARRATEAARLAAYHREMDAARRWLRHADTALARAGGDAALARAATHVRGLLHMRDGETEEAAALLESIRREGGASTDDEVTWLATADLVDLYTTTQTETARRLAQQLADETTNVLGPSHPRMARIELDLASIARHEGDGSEEREHVRRAVDVSMATYGATNSRTAVPLVRLGLAEHAAGDLVAASTAYMAALQASAEHDDVWRSRAFLGLGRVLAQRGQPAEAAQALTEGMSVGRDLWRPDGIELVATRRCLAEVWIELGRFDDARAELELLEPVLHERGLAAQLGVALTQGVLAEERGDLDAARATYDEIAHACPEGAENSAASLCAVGRAWSDVLASPQDRRALPAVDETSDPVLTSSRRFVEAQRAWADDRHGHARQLAEQALAAVATGGEFLRRQQRRRLRRWQAAHAAGPPPGASH